MTPQYIADCREIVARRANTPEWNGYVDIMGRLLLESLDEIEKFQEQLSTGTPLCAVSVSSGGVETFNLWVSRLDENGEPAEYTAALHLATAPTKDAAIRAGLLALASRLEDQFGLEEEAP